MFGRFGAMRSFPGFRRSTELIRGTPPFIRNHECSISAQSSSQTGCAALDQLIGSKIAVGNVELRFPLTRSLVLGFLPLGFHRSKARCSTTSGWRGTTRARQMEPRGWR